MVISFDDFLKVDIRAGTIIKAKAFSEARNPAYKLWVDLGGELGIKKTSAQITQNYSLEELEGKKVAAVVNFKPKQIGKFMSEILVLGFPDHQSNVSLISIEESVPNGARLY